VAGQLCVLHRAGGGELVPRTRGQLQRLVEHPAVSMPSGSSPAGRVTARNDASIEPDRIAAIALSASSSVTTTRRARERPHPDTVQPGPR
jgi:hypothetical protein